MRLHFLVVVAISTLISSTDVVTAKSIKRSAISSDKEPRAQTRRSLRTEKMVTDEDEERVFLEKLKSFAGTQSEKLSKTLSRSKSAKSVGKATQAELESAAKLMKTVKLSKLPKNLQKEIKSNILFNLEDRKRPATLYLELKLSSLPRSDPKWTEYSEYVKAHKLAFPHEYKQGFKRNPFPPYSLKNMDE